MFMAEVCACRKNELEELMLLNLSKKTWTEGLLLQNFSNHAASNEKVRHSNSDTWHSALKGRACTARCIGHRLSTSIK